MIPITTTKEKLRVTKNKANTEKNNQIGIIKSFSKQGEKEGTENQSRSRVGL